MSDENTEFMKCVVNFGNLKAVGEDDQQKQS